MDTWGITGPAFLGIYGGVLAIAGVVVFGICRWIRSESDRSGLVGLRTPELSPYEVAMLKGGESLVLTVVACRLKGAGSLKLNERGAGLVVAGPLPASPDRIESWAYSLVQRTPGSGKAMLDEKVAGPVLAPIRQRLLALGLMLEDRQRSLIRRQLLWFMPVLGLGVARVIAGSQDHRPIGFLVMVILAAAWGAYALTTPPSTTLAGRRRLKRLEGDSAALGSYGSAGEVALSGVVALWATDSMLASASGIKRGAGGFGGGAGCGGGGGCGGGCGG
jgi:uncharacterized protein (TIGR04222 family)